MEKLTFSVLITTKNRKDDLVYTLQKSQDLLSNDSVEFVICDDGSTDGTAVFIQQNYPNIKLIQNEKSKGLIYSRNRLMNLVTAEFAISIDDDAHFITENFLEVIEKAFNEKPKVGLFSFRIFWGLQKPETTYSDEVSYRMKSFVGCGHVWRMSAWKNIPDYPSWFVFYGEEAFASYQLFKKKWEVHYLPDVLVHHRVDVKSRKKNKDYSIRLRRSLRSGWYLYFLFYPLNEIPKRFLYTLWAQFKLKIFKGDFQALLAIVQALFDLFLNFVRLTKQSNRLTKEEFNQFIQLSETKYYWKPEQKI